MKKYVVWGMGLLGTSLALDLKKRGGYVVGVEKSLENIEILKGYGFDRIWQSDDESLFDDLRDCAGIIIGTPVDQVFPILERISRHEISPAAWVTDMASTKSELMRQVSMSQDPMIGRLNFIGSHPMAGSDLNGPAHARLDLFKDATIYITPQGPQDVHGKPAASGNPGLKNEVAEFWKTVGARPFEISSEVHDKWAAYLSHGLHLVSCMVSHLLEEIPEVYDLQVSPAGGSFRDITRVAGSNPRLWDGIINSNAGEVTRYLESLEKLIHEWKVLLAEKKLPVEDIFKKAGMIRSAIIKTEQNEIKNNPKNIKKI